MDLIQCSHTQKEILCHKNNYKFIIDKNVIQAKSLQRFVTKTENQFITITYYSYLPPF